MGSNPFKNNDFPVVEAEQWKDVENINAETVSKNELAMLALKDGTATEAMINEMRGKVNKRNKAISTLIDSNKGESARNLSEALTELDRGVIDSAILSEVQNNIKTPKDMLDYAKATEAIYNRMIKQATSTSDPNKRDDSMRNIKIGVMYGNGQQIITIGGDEDE